MLNIKKKRHGQTPNHKGSGQTPNHKGSGQTPNHKGSGQTTLEYAILVVIVIAALLSLQTYVKRGVQGRLKDSSDDIGEQFSFVNTGNYYKKTYSKSNTTQTFANGVSATTLVGTKTANMEKGSEFNMDNAYWGK